MEFVAKHNRAALAAAKEYAADKPWQGDFADRVEKIRFFHTDLLEAYGIEVDLIVDTDGGNPTKAGGFIATEGDNTAIVLYPGFAIMTYLRLFAEALSYSRDLRWTARYGGVAGYAAAWANGLFKKAFPKSWEKLVARNAPILTRDYA